MANTDGVKEYADKMAKEIDKQALANLLAASRLMSGDGGYEESTHEKYEEFNRKRNYPIPGTIIDPGPAFDKAQQDARNDLLDGTL